MIREDEGKKGSKLLSYQFRTKEQLDNGTFYTRSCRKEYADGMVVRASRLDDAILDMFYIGTDRTFRQSCYECKYRSTLRTGDITIGDAWGVDKLYPEFNPYVGISLICINTEKGKQLGEAVLAQMDYRNVEYSDMTVWNHGYRKEMQ